jgi:hypothetical protein
MRKMSCLVWKQRADLWPFCSAALWLFLGSFLLFSVSAFAKNPFLYASTNDRALATFSGTEWGDEIGKKEVPLSCKVVTVRVGNFTWGDAYLISFESVKSQTGKPRKLDPILLWTTDKEIVRVSTDKPEEEIKKLKERSAAPKYEQSDLLGISQGNKTYKETGLTVAKITTKGDTLRYTWNHKSGHFLILEWKRGVGLVEYAQNRGARSDGFRLKRGVSSL